MTKVSLWWHMIVRGHTEETILAVNSLQGLYDGLIVAVDDREDSNDVFDALLYYPNTFVYRQHFDDFKRYDLARQDCLNQVPDTATFVGWSDSDEILVTDPYKVRVWLFKDKPEAVNCGIHYIYPIGGHEAGQTYRNGRVRIWKHKTRHWERPCHEYPVPDNGIDNPVIGDIIFNHIKESNTDYRADHHIQLMQEEIDSGNLGWMFYQAKEHLIKGDIDAAKEIYLEYIKSGDESRRDDAITQLGELYLSRKEYSDLINAFDSISIKDHPMILEYIAIAYYWFGGKKQAYDWHQIAKKNDVNNKYPRLVDNDIYFVK